MRLILMPYERDVFRRMEEKYCPRGSVIHFETGFSGPFTGSLVGIGLQKGDTLLSVYSIYLYLYLSMSFCISVRLYACTCSQSNL